MIKYNISDFPVSGECFSVTYSLSGDEKEALLKAEDICLEQTVEFPPDLLPEKLRNTVAGKIKSFEKSAEGIFKTLIEFPVETSAFEFTQFLNVLFGNISFKPGIQLESFELPEGLLKFFRGPRFGIEGLRKVLSIPKRPLLCTTLKPMGLSSKNLYGLAYQFALGGIDIIKDDHGLTNQPFSPFEERVKLCSKAVAKANKETGLKSIYVPNITSPLREIEKRVNLAKEAGAGGLLISPSLTGFDTMKNLAEDDFISLPLLSHPAFQGSFVLSRSGISHYALFGQIVRLAGADVTIYPNFGGRFSSSREECKNIILGCSVPMGHIKNIFPCPGGGMTFENIPDMFKFYGTDVIYLVGGGLFRHSDNLTENCRYFRNMVDNV
ncbi:MAG TPA: RuBisCO large subunit C-terminal-like domain-containing protein [Candidatus Eremiobacteraeota bacterium]|nr:MAG: 2,3-diketo-5-methylthiopentyl-1-phosphate enolase [bacterium ADurb.Bin363]HPZ07991.1 RuBisCO large subunit C-terminal-like domain-containing protein [Candidatus Eremiobacteraeota bacterium]